MIRGYQVRVDSLLDGVAHTPSWRHHFWRITATAGQEAAHEDTDAVIKLVEPPYAGASQGRCVSAGATRGMLLVRGDVFRFARRG